MIERLKKLAPGKITSYLILLFWTFLTIYPLYFTLISSLKTQSDMFSNIFGLPKKIQLANYTELFTQMKIQTYVFNSLFISTVTVFIQVIIGAMASFILARFAFKFKKLIIIFFMVGILIPMQSVMIPIALIAKSVNGYNSYIFMIACYVTFGIPYFVFVVTGFMKAIPKEIEEAAIIDGCSGGSLFWKIIMPLSLPALSTMAILSFFGAWNELILALVLLKRTAMKTISLGLINFAGDQFANYPGQCAAVIISILPTLVIYLLLQENIIKGMTAGAVKG
ncbi:MAG TPA: carbohydrate ABC transporter permease [Ruminiclostridium sp.]